MVAHLAVALAAFTLVASPDPALAPPPPADAVAFDLGHLLGAASACGMFDRDRLQAATVKAKRLIRQSVERQGADDLEVNERYRDGVEDGREAVLNDETSCSDVEAGLGGLEARQDARDRLLP
jgi:hypothetical protein